VEIGPSPGGDESAGDFQPGEEEEEGSGSTMLILGTVLVTLAVVATVVGAVVAVRLMRKRSGTTHAIGMYNNNNDGFSQMNDGGFDSVVISENRAGAGEQQAVWGDVLELRKGPAAGEPGV
jgi:hypothetical protein